MSDAVWAWHRGMTGHGPEAGERGGGGGGQQPAGALQHGLRPRGAEEEVRHLQCAHLRYPPRHRAAGGGGGQRRGPMPAATVATCLPGTVTPAASS